MKRRQEEGLEGPLKNETEVETEIETETELEGARDRGWDREGFAYNVPTIKVYKQLDKKNLDQKAVDQNFFPREEKKNDPTLISFSDMSQCPKTKYGLSADVFPQVRKPAPP